VRLDKYLVTQGYFESRNRALAAIKSGEVTVDGHRAKASHKVSSEALVEVTQSKFYVSRAAKKLESFLQTYPLPLLGCNALDIGSSTGGFAQILLEHDVKALCCVDVGSDQLHHSLRDNPRLTLHEGMDIRDFDPAERFDLITCDVSFISLLQIIEDIDRLAAEGTRLVLLYKPQFEVGRSVKRDSRGVVTDTEAIKQCQQAFLTQTAALGWQLQQQALSQLAGKEGNSEYFYAFIKQ